MAADRGDPLRDGRGKFARTVEHAERDAEACRLKSRGSSFQEISDLLGYGGKQNAHRAVRKALAAIPALPAEELRRTRLELLDYLTVRALAVLERDHLTVTQGGKIVKGDDGKPLIDDGPVLQAIDRLLRIQKRAAEVDGSDAPTKHEVITLDYLDAQIEQLTAELASGTEAAETDPTAGAEG